MASNDGPNDSNNTGGLHPPIFSKQRKTSTHPKHRKPAQAGGGAMLDNLFKPLPSPPPSSPPKPSNPAPYAFSSLGAETPFDGPDISEPKEPKMDDLSAKLGDLRVELNSITPLQDYSAEARVYHCRYEDLSETLDRGEHDLCLQGCLDLLTEPRIPRYTRIQTLQMLSTLLPPAHAAVCLKDAEVLLEAMDSAKFQVQSLREDNDRMRKDLEIWRDAGPGEGERDDGGPSKKWFEHDREVQRELEAEARAQMDESSSDMVSLPVREKPAQGPEATSPPTSEADIDMAEKLLSPGGSGDDEVEL
ncbi:hypothetical protein LTR27_003304 [Elasticomyces elasticus]|nr:hypothetical protein LTR27_003304 [Elasticomyces elasticus]